MAPILSIEGFEAPLDWLLEMARGQKIDLARLPIAALIGAFAAALEAALARREGVPPPEFGRRGEWLVMAATLAWLRSRLLLPQDTPANRAAVHGPAARPRQHGSGRGLAGAPIHRRAKVA